MTANPTRVSVDGAPLRPPGRAGRNLPAAIGVGLGLGAVIIASLFVYRQIFLVVIAAALVLAVTELAQAFAVRDAAMPVWLMMGGTAGMVAGGYYGGARVLAAVLAGTALLCLVVRMRGGIAGFVRDVTATVFALLYVPFLAGFVVLMLRPGEGARLVLTFIIVTISSDIGGYAVGVVAGRHLMTPTISPKKSWEGFAGSTVGCLIAGVLCVGLLLSVGWAGWWVGLALGALTVLAATLGDLVESLIKRDLGIKDMGTLLPGHGGIMDRLDSLLFAAPVAWLVLTFVLPHA